LGKTQGTLRSLHDGSDGGALVAVAEGLFARNFGAQIDIPPEQEPWRFSFGEGFHSFIASVSEADAPAVEAECKELGLQLTRIGTVTHTPQLIVKNASGSWSLPTSQLKAAWQKGGYWE
jgi:phosphoribosylformylglycinamidine synthase